MENKAPATTKTLYVETDSAEVAAAKSTGVLRVIIGDAFDAASREKQYKGKRRQDFFNYWTLPVGMRDKAVHAELKRACYADRVTYADPDGDVQSVEAFDFVVDPAGTVAEWKQTVIDLITEVVDRLGGDVQLKQFIPTTWQRRAIGFVANALAAGKSTLMLELAARFGKTGTSLSLFDYSSADVMVIANYVKTVNSSFGNTVVDFFSDRMVYVDSASEGAKDKIDAAIAAGKKVVVACSLHKSAKLNDRIEMIRGYGNRMVFVDEADFGAHTKAQVAKVNDLREGVPLILMTGTGADLAAATHKIDAIHTTTYFDMLLQSARG